MDLGLEEKDGFEFWIVDPAMKLTMEQRKRLDPKAPELGQQWRECQFSMIDLNDERVIELRVNRERREFAVCLSSIQNGNRVQNANESKWTVIDKVEDGAHRKDGDESSVSTTSTTNTSTNPTSKYKRHEMAVQMASESATSSNVEIGDRIMFLVTSSGLELWFGDRRCGSFEYRFETAHSVLLQFEAKDEFAAIEKAHFFSSSLLKQMPTFLELKLFVANLEQFEPDDLEDRLNEVLCLTLCEQRERERENAEGI